MVEQGQSVSLGQPGTDTIDGERPQPHQEVVHSVEAFHPPLLGESLQFEFDLTHHVGVEQLAQLSFAQQLCKKVAVEGQRRGTAFRQGGVALVEVGGDEVEEQRRGEGAGAAGDHLGEPDAAGLDAAEHLTQRGEVEVVLEYLPVGLENDGKGPELTGHGQEVGGTAPLLPQGGPRPGAAAGEEQTPDAASRKRAAKRAVSTNCSIRCLGLIRVDGRSPRRRQRRRCRETGRPSRHRTR